MDYRQKIIDILKETPFLTKRQLVEVVTGGGSNIMLDAALMNACRDGDVVKSGEKRGTKYSLPGQVEEEEEVIEEETPSAPTPSIGVRRMIPDEVKEERFTTATEWVRDFANRHAVFTMSMLITEVEQSEIYIPVSIFRDALRGLIVSGEVFHNCKKR